MYRYACLPPPQFASFRECLSYTPPKFVSGSGKSSHPAKLFRSATLQNSAYNPHLRQVDGALTVEVLPGVVVPQLVLDRVQDEPALFPGLQQGPPLVQVTLHTMILHREFSPPPESNPCPDVTVMIAGLTFT